MTRIDFLKKGSGCGENMDVMSRVTSNGRKIPIPHFILKREWKFKDQFTHFPFVPTVNQGFLCLINLSFIQLRNRSFVENNDYSNTKGNSVNSVSFAICWISWKLAMLRNYPAGSFRQGPFGVYE